MIEAQILVLAKEPRPGHVKTRLCPPLTPDQAARVAGAAIGDTLDAVRSLDVAARVLVLDGSAAALDTSGFDVQSQGAGGLDRRLAEAFDTAYDTRPLPLLLIGMDTPQVTARQLHEALQVLLADGTDAVLGLAQDGGWWALGLRRPDAGLLVGVPMSSDVTGQRQQERLDAAGLRTRALPVLRDIDDVEDLRAAAVTSPSRRVAAVVAELLSGSAA